MSRYQAVVFDKDGTLIDVDLTWGPVFARVIPVVAGDKAAEAAAARQRRNSRPVAGMSTGTNAMATNPATITATIKR